MLLVLAAAAAIAVTVLPLRLEMTVRGKGEWGKLWVLAAGVQMGPLTISFAAANQIDSVLQVHVFGLRLLRRSPVRRAKPEPLEKKQSKSLQQWMQMAKDYRARIERWVALDDLLDLILSLRAYVRFPRFEGKISYATPDYATTGMLLGALYSIAGLFFPLGNLRVEPIWEERAVVHGDLTLSMRLWVVRAFWHVLVFAVKHVNIRRHSSPGRTPAALSS